ncbi:sporulation domain-containing protein [mine drainage metagenome]|uniref:Sporulation domain-containing protein n=1 Tax=mine drainage metagenome TaxID=410659 RepID=T1BR52_9ZZZZ
MSTRNPPVIRPGRRRKRKRRQYASKASFRPWGWVSLLLAFVVVLLLVIPVIRHSIRTAERLEQRGRHPLPATPKPKPPTPALRHAERTFSFYQLLTRPRFEIANPGLVQNARTDYGHHPVRHPGQYLIQVGSFRRWSQANRLKAQLAFWGILAHIHSVRIDNGETWNRVQIGPIGHLRQLNQVRAALARHHVTSLLIELKHSS